MFQRAEIEPTPGIALCMASGMISDTLFLRSPTTTTIDREVLAWLQQYCDVDLDEYANEFFQVGSALRSCTPAAGRPRGLQGVRGIRRAGSRFLRSKRLVSICSGSEKTNWRSRFEGLATANRFEFSALLVTDIASNGSLLLMSSEPDGWDEINYPQLEDKLYQLDEVVSRKKQLLPLIISLLESSPVTAR